MQMKSPLFSRALFCAALLTAPILTSCGGSTNSAPLPLSVNISPNSVNLAAGQAQTFVAIINGSNNTKVNWSVLEGAAGGAITDVGAYRAPMSPGTFHVVATSMADSTKSASATVIVPPISVAISPSTVTVTSGETRTFTAVVTGSLDQMVTWRVQEGSAGGTINSSGVYLAPSTFGTYHVVATSQADPMKSGTATVTVAPVSVAIMPASVGMRPGGTQSFSATVTGSSNVSVTWTVQEGAAGGTITDAGSYTAPTALGTYHVIVTSEADPSKSATATISVLQSGFFTPTGSMGSGRGFHTASLLLDGKVLIAGGTGHDCADFVCGQPTAELYDPATGSFTSKGNMGGARFAHTATILANGRVLVTGGLGTSAPIESGGRGPKVSSSAEIYDPATGSFAATGSMGTARANHTATLLPDGKVLIVGGVQGIGNSDGSFPYFTVGTATAELYDPATGSFTPTSSMTTQRFSHTATLLPSGKVLVAGGISDSSSSSSPLVVAATAELYDPTTGSFTSTGNMGTARGAHTATLLPKGKVLVAGGVGSGTLATAELYDPATGSFAPATSMEAARQLHTATLLPSGRVLLAGGMADNRSGITTAELYDPATGTFTPTGSMRMPRTAHTATMLQNGNVLVTGGVDATAELYE